jgi:hypothetical protein
LKSASNVQPLFLSPDHANEMLQIVLFLLLA